MQSGLKQRLVFGVFTMILVVGCLALWLGFRAFTSVTVRQPDAYAMQSAGQLIVDHLRLHSGAWPRSWAELRDTCAETGMHIVSTNADSEIEELKKRIEIDWSADPESIRRLGLQADAVPATLVRLRSGSHASFVGAEPNQMIWDYLKKTTEPGRAANGSQPMRPETNSTSPAAGSRR
jgi:hypothetical protein